MSRGLALATGAFVAATTLSGGVAHAAGTAPAAPAPAHHSRADLDPLRAEHAAMAPRVDCLRTTADSVGTADDAQLHMHAERAHRWLETVLLPHAAVEEEVLYGYVDQVIGKGGSSYAATATMTGDHDRVAALTDELGTLGSDLADGVSDQEATDLRRILYSLNALIDLHFDKEETVYLPALETGLSAGQGEQLLEDMEAAHAGGADSTAAGGELGTTASGPAHASRADMDPLREEHAGIKPRIRQIRTTADSVGTVGEAELRADVRDTRVWLQETVLPHAQVEDAVQFPAVDEIIGKGGSEYSATATMTADHRRVGQLVGELGTLEVDLDNGMSDQEATDLRRILYSLNALIDLHFAKEEAVYLPALEERLSAGQGERLLEQMEAFSAGTSRRAG